MRNRRTWSQEARSKFLAQQEKEKEMTEQEIYPYDPNLDIEREKNGNTETNI